MDSSAKTTREDAESAAAAWIARRESDQWSTSAQTELDAWISADTSHRVAWLRLDAAWKKTERLRTLRSTARPGTVPTRDEIGLPFSGLPSDSKARSTALRTRRSAPFALAASAVFVVATCSAWYFLGRDHAPTYSTEVGALRTISVADGSTVTLNTDSAIRIALTTRERRVELRAGEAFFQVAKDPTRPFVVVAGNERVVAVGTAFSVRRDGTDIRIAVSDGQVRIESADGAPTAAPAVRLEAGSTARANGQGVIVHKGPITEVEQTLNWRSGFLTFDQSPLSDAIAEFNRYNIHQVVIADPAIAKIPVGGSFRATNVDAFIRLMETDSSLSATRDGNQILLRARPPADP